MLPQLRPQARVVWFALLYCLIGVATACNCSAAVAQQADQAAAAPPAQPVVPPPPLKPAKLTKIEIRNDGLGKATCTVIHEDNFDEAGLTISVDAKHAAEAASSLEVITEDPAQHLQVVIGMAPANPVANVQKAFRLDPGIMNAVQLGIRLNELANQSITVTVAGAKKDQTITLLNFDGTNLNSTDVPPVVIPIAKVEQIVPASTVLAGGANSGITIKALSGLKKTKGTVRYRFATTPWAPQYRVTLTPNKQHPLKFDANFNAHSSRLPIRRPRT